MSNDLTTPRPTLWAASAGRPPRSTGFTLVEMLVVIGVIALLAGIVLVGLDAARRATSGVASQQFLNSVSMALAAYERDFDDLPPSWHENLNRNSLGLAAGSFEDWSGAEILAQALVAPRADDGQPGMGFTHRSGSYGPYLQADSERNLVYVATDSGQPFDEYEIGRRGDEYSYDSVATPPPDSRWALTTNRGAWPILYYRAERHRGTVAFDEGEMNNWVWGPEGRFNTEDNATLLELPGVDWDMNTPAQRWGWNDNDPHAQEARSFGTSLRGADFLLVAPGHDNLWGTDDDLTVTGP